MSFNEPPSNIIEYYIFTKKYTSNLRPIGEISGNNFNINCLSYSLSEIQSTFPGFIQPDNTIIQNASTYIRSLSNNIFIVGIPNKNNNNLSRKKILALIANANIGELQTVVPYTKQAGNDITIPTDPNSCISPKQRKLQVLKYGNTSVVSELTGSEIKSIIDKLAISNRICLANTKYSIA